MIDSYKCKNKEILINAIIINSASENDLSNYKIKQKNILVKNLDSLNNL